jgi:uncharacterized protein (DUF2236 family)
MPLGPDSAVWRNALDWRLLLGSGRALLLQVAHPTVGAGVAQYSNFRAEPWDRLRRTVKSLMIQSYGGDAAAVEAARLRELHKDIKGIDHHGERYHALDPEAYWWVHATLFEGTVELHATFGKPMPAAEQRQLYDEWRELGVMLGIKEHRMPADLTGFWAYFHGMVENRLEDNKSVRDVLASLGERKPVRPPWWPLPGVVWRRLAGPAGATILTTATVGTLPPVLRKRVDLQWTERDARRLRLLQTVVRVGMPLVPAKLRYHPLALRAKRCSS